MRGSDDKHDDESGVDWLESQLSDDEPDEPVPAETEPAGAEAAEIEPAEPEAAEAEPAVTDPGTEPSEDQPTVAETTADAQPEPALTDATETKPSGDQPTVAAPAPTEPTPQEPAPQEPVEPEPSPEPPTETEVVGVPETAGASAVPDATPAATPAAIPTDSWPDTPVDAQRPPTEDEAATAILDAPVPAQSALPIPVPVQPPAPAGDAAPENPAPTSAAASAAVPGAYEAPAAAATAYAPPAPPVAPKSRIPKIALWIGAGILAVGVLVALFFLGQRLAGGTAPVAAPTPTATPSPSATPTPTPTPTPIVGPRAPGVYAWDQLGGGECLQPYVSPWEEEFTVLDCAAPHAAQLVYRGTYAGDATTVFPGEAALASEINLLCSAPGVIDLAAARAFPDLQVQGSFPVTAEQWTGGQRHYYCFVSRAGGEPLTASVAGPGPVAAG